MPVEERIRQIEINMERWRWLPQDLGENHLLVNIANFELAIVERGETVKTMRAVVGRPYRRTPVFSGIPIYLVLSPFWHVPPGIARNDALPRVRKAPDYLTRENFKVLQGWGAEVREIDPATVDWTRVDLVL